MTENVKWQGAVEQIRRTATSKGRQQLNCFSIEGIRLHERAIRAGVDVIFTIVSPSFAQNESERGQTLHIQLQTTDAPVFVVPNEIMDELTNGRSLGGIISLVKKPAPPNLAELVTAVSNPTLLVTQSIVDPGNVGAMIRTAHANGVTAFIINEGSDPYHPKAVRTTMGSIFKIPILQRPSLDDLLHELTNLRIETVGTVASNGFSLPNTQFSKRGTAVFMGSEYFGLSDDLIPKLDKLITIPMNTGVDSMSVNAATAVVLYELQRQNLDHR